MLKQIMGLGIGAVFLLGCGSGAESISSIEDDSRSLDTKNVMLLSETFDDVGLAYLNQLRNFAGMTQFSANSYLNTAAQNHASYQITNNFYTHGEQSSYVDFSGKTPSQRVLTTGYSHGDISENIYAGDVSTKHAIDILFSNIYHRLAFLDFGFDEIGFGMGASQSYDFKKVYTYEIGRENFRAFNDAQNPKIVLWPYKNQQDVMPVFYEEQPDPLPECSVSGYPISIQFNPSKNGKIEMESFKLYDADKEITDTVLLELQSDFVLMPLTRLEWGHTYSMSAKYSENGKPYSLSWEFTTKSLPEPYFIVEKTNQNFMLKSGETYHFYLPPKDCNDKFTTYRYKYTAGLNVEERIVDNNTIKIKAVGKGVIEINPDHGRSFTLDIN
jgi:uncharacterized protein YkwD